MTHGIPEHETPIRENTERKGPLQTPLPHAVTPQPGRLPVSPSSRGTACSTLPARVRQAICVSLLALSDIAATIVASALGLVLHAGLSSWLEFTPVPLYYGLDAVFVLTVAILSSFLLRGMYLRREPFWEHVRLTLTTILAALCFLIGSIFIFKAAEIASRPFLLLCGTSLLAIMPAARMLTLYGLYRAGLWRQRVLVVTSGVEAAEEIAKDLTADPALGYSVVAAISHAEVWSSLEDLPDVEEVVISRAGAEATSFAQMVSRLQHRYDAVTVIPELGDLPFGWGTARFLFDCRRILLTSRNKFKDPVNLLIKRCSDLMASSLLLLALSPLMVLIGLAIRLSSPGPALLKQERLGRGGTRFGCLKFRTMYLDAEERLEMILKDPLLREEWQTYRKLLNDPRVTPIGRVLRSTSMDELPQLLNILKGDMSLVGPRPYMPREHKDMGEEAETVLTTWPGLTGLWQVSGRREIPFEGRVWLEAWYVRNWSPWLDITIFFRTFPAVLFRRGAH